MSRLQSTFLEYFVYREGKLFNKISRSARAREGEEAGFYTESNGRFSVGVDGKQYLRSRIIFCMSHGYMPDVVDHIDGNIINDFLDNLRGCSKSENQWNRFNQSDNLSGFKGVGFHKKVGKYQARIKHFGKSTFLGYFDTAEEASKVYEAKAMELRPIYHRKSMVQ